MTCQNVPSFKNTRLYSYPRAYIMFLPAIIFPGSPKLLGSVTNTNTQFGRGNNRLSNVGENPSAFGIKRMPFIDREESDSSTSSK